MTPAIKHACDHKRASFELGRRSGFAGRRVRIRQRELFNHSLVLGTTGSGKTTAALTLLCQAIECGWGVVMIDLKGDPDNAACLAGAAARAQTSYRQFAITPGERCDTWHPLAAGDPAARMSKVMCLSEWTEPYYKSACERFVQLAFVLMERNRIAPSFERLVQMLDNPASIHQNTGALAEAERVRIDQYVARLLADRGQLSALAGLASRIGTLTDLGGALREMAGERIDLDRLSAHGGVCVFSLNSARSAVTASQVGALALLDVQSMVATRIATGERARPVIVCVDEFSGLDGDHLLGLFARARSSRVAMLLSTQELSDLSRVDDGFANQIIGLTSTKLIMRQEVADSADELARTIGTRRAVKSTQQTDRSLLCGAGRTGRGSERATEEFIQHPNVFKRLRCGQAVLVRKDPFRVDRVTVRAKLAQPDMAATIAREPPPPLAPPPRTAHPTRSATGDDVDSLYANRTH